MSEIDTSLLRAARDALDADLTGTGVLDHDGKVLLRGKIARYLSAAPSPATPEAEGAILNALDEYERRTKLLPIQHEIPERGCCSYNWRMAVIKEIRALVASPPAAQPSPDALPDHLRGEERELYIHRHDCPVAWASYDKHVLGLLERPSCFACGKVGDSAVEHLELADIYICVTCKAKLDAAAQEQKPDETQESYNADHWCPKVCPITGREFFMWLETEEGEYVPTYGGPYDSYTIPEREGEDWSCQRYDHDAGAWVEGWETTGLIVTRESAASPIPASGWVMVPKQATTEMKVKGGVAYEKFNRNVVIGEIWDAMLSVAPGETK